jgi:hypothetical protein
VCSFDDSLLSNLDLSSLSGGGKWYSLVNFRFFIKRAQIPLNRNHFNAKGVLNFSVYESALPENAVFATLEERETALELAELYNMVDSNEINVSVNDVVDNNADNSINDINDDMYSDDEYSDDEEVLSTIDTVHDSFYALPDCDDESVFRRYYRVIIAKTIVGSSETHNKVKLVRENYFEDIFYSRITLMQRGL